MESTATSARRPPRACCRCSRNTMQSIDLFCPFTGAEPMRGRPTATSSSTSASYREETAGLVDQIRGIGRKRIAVFYQIDAYGRGGWDGVRQRRWPPTTCTSPPRPPTAAAPASSSQCANRSTSSAGPTRTRRRRRDLRRRLRRLRRLSSATPATPAGTYPSPTSPSSAARSCSTTSKRPARVFRQRLHPQSH